MSKKLKFFNYFLILLIVFFVIVLFFIFHNFILAAAAAPTVTFSGDDILQNGGTDDAYDSLLAMDITTAQASPDTWDLQYSNDAGQTWQTISPNYIVVSAQRRQYYWSTSKVYAPTLLLRVRTAQSGVYTDYYQAALALSHRATNNGGHYFVESFNDSTYQGASSNITWDTGQALMELAKSGGNNYKPNGSAVSLDLLSGFANGNILSATFQPVQRLFDGTQYAHYQLSNDGTNWYGSTGLGSYFSFLGQIVPEAVTVTFNQSVGDKLYWRSDLHAANPHDSPQIYQLRFKWQENSAPQACFTVSPTNSNSKSQVYAFNANCSSDYEDSLSQLSFRWDWENNGTWDTVSQAGAAGYSKTHIYNSTSTFTAKVEVKDTYGATGNFLNSINQSGVSGSVSGWLWASTFGWASLNCDNTYYGTAIRYCPPDYGWELNPDYTMSGWAWDANAGWICLGSSCTGLTPDGQASIAVYSRVDGIVTGWAKYILFGESGWLKLRGDWCGADSENDQCVHVNLSQRSLLGWGWAGGVNAAGVADGPGWVQFAGSLNVPWLETKYGAVYGQNNAGSSNTAMAPQGRYNSSYCILATGNIVNLTSENGCLRSGYPDLKFPNASEKYRTVNGVIDFERILNGEETVYKSQDVDANLPNVLAGQVYHFTGQDSYTIDNPLTFYNARNFNSTGAGTVVVDGDLYINSNIFYENSAVASKIENLASAAWIVKGDVIIDSSVTNLAGDFIVLGKTGIGCPAAGCGNFKTGNDAGSPKQLIISGLAMARQFSFERFYKQAGEPAEKIIYDGRVIINTPPGLEDVAKGLPIWREAYTTTQIEQ
ncbi:MAG: hypothetical protein NTZ18_02980 [Candidatus Komeilibacteria bacterium]|nr:hypothetical protein [Candidatus Komeilibacteria bacterium]